jgi:hypothetical protein
MEPTLREQTTGGGDDIITGAGYSRPADHGRVYVRRTQLISLRANERSFVWWRGA